MKKIIVVFIVFIAILTSFNINAFASEDNTPEQFFEKMLPLALYYQKTEGVLVSLNLGQSALETGYGEHLNDGNNYYGYTYSYNGKAYYKSYDSMAESMADYVQNFSKSRYDRVRLADNYKDACYAVKACGYAADEDYAGKVISIIEKYELYKYDQYEPPIFTCSRGDRGVRVEMVQEMLLQLGYDLDKYGVDGKYGDVTRNAVRIFQRDHNLFVDGEVNTETMELLAYLTKDVA